MKKSLLLITSLSICTFAAVLDIVPKDYVAGKSGLNIMSVNFLNKNSIGPYSKGEKLTNDSISQKSYFLRYNYLSNIAEFATSYGVVLPYTQLKTEGSTLSSAIGEKSNGLSDSLFTSTIWLKNDKKEKEYLGLTFVLVTPSGKYDDSQTLNTSENRYKYVFALGYIRPLSENITFEISPELAFYGDNKTDSSTTKQEPSYALNTYLRYKLNKSYEAFAGYQYSYNSQTTVNNIEQNNEHSSNKYSLGAIYTTEKYNQFMLRYAKEDSKEFGMKVKDEIFLRYRWWF
jgi:hypothetical protein